MSHRVVGVVAIVLVAIALATSGCSRPGVTGTATSPSAAEGSDGPSPGQPSVGEPTTPHDETTLRPAATAKLPKKLNGWTVNGPVESTANIEAGSYSLPGKTNLAVVNITRNPGLSARQMLADMMIDDPQPTGVALCGTVGLNTSAPTVAPSAPDTAAPSAGSVICLVDLDGGVLNVSGPATVAVSEYAKFANDLYGSFPA